MQQARYVVVEHKKTVHCHSHVCRRMEITWCASSTHHKINDGEYKDAVEAAPSRVSQPGAQNGCQVAGALKQHELD